jgi:PAS domain S-box-containing protein
MEKLNEIQHLEALINGQLQVLEMITQDKPINEILNGITLWVERQARHSLFASILILDKDGKHLLHGAAPNLAAEYNKAIHGIEIGPSVGSCGTAAFSKQQVIVEDIENDPLWANYKDLALSFGLKACWSTPLISKDGRVLGTFAIYYKEPRKPDEEDLRIIKLVSRTAVLAIENKLAREAKEVSEQSFRLMTDSIPALVWVADAAGSMIYFNNRCQKFTGINIEDLKSNKKQNILYPGDLRKAQKLLAECRKSGENFQQYLRIRSADGEYRWHLTLAYPQKDTKGNVKRWYGSCMDVHDQKILVQDLEIANLHSSMMADELQKAVNQMEDERKVLQDLLMNAPAIICILRGPDHRFELVNPHYQSLFPGRKLQGFTIKTALPEAEKQGFIALLDNVYNTGVPFKGKTILFNIEEKDKTRQIYVDILYHPLYKQGKIDGISVFAHDVTALVEAQAGISTQIVKIDD